MKGQWKDPGNYNAGLSPNGWAWEFLRRNPLYQKDWKRYDRVVRRYGTFEDAQQRAPAREAWECDPPARRGETLDDWNARVADRPHEALALRSAVAKRWGLHMVPVDPRKSASSEKVIFWLPTLFIRSIGGWKASEARLQLRPQEMAVVFDLSIPLRPQVSRIGRSLRETQKWLQTDKKMKIRIDTPKHPPHKLVEYLRILDARSQGATDKSIISSLYPDKIDAYPNNTARQTLAASEAVAVSLRDGGYRDLVLLQTRRRTKKD